MRLIDADALMETIKKHDYPLRDYFNSTGRGMFTFGIQQAVDEQPTIDAVEVVRCKDCKYYRKIDHGGICVLLAREEKMADDWFCADGDRRE